MTSYKFYQIDAFTSSAFEGNPAGVILIDKSWPNDEILQKIAREINLSETVFVQKLSNHKYKIRFFTPTCEVPLCGHATLSAAFVLFNKLNLKANQLIFNTMDLQFQVDYNPKNKLVKLKFPLYSLQQLPNNTKISEILDLPITELYACDNNWKMAVCENEFALQNLHVNAETLTSNAYGQLIITAKSNSEKDFVYRCFVPDLGILEDPVTGSAQCALIPYWSSILNKRELISQQVSGRKNTITAQVNANNISIFGTCTTVIVGNLMF
ncbi:PhzF family phenazine biosynthesis protein [Psychroflexus sp. ALD_RP9]|uniref:PhzF family phenazine biosynthesis protein n=1 Tax=Psychroflexus sp. ALD_RP9 TaxID=2777186 RepID=UPI001A8C44BE|nr:PhzF family phenazine biosynthesis protein [Psychroflexus sp. ALD_RP9]QSS97013.1 PhzF family phenazine biosynthesis protein [Psychroflexus sp. ALD_RP9]